MEQWKRNLYVCWIGTFLTSAALSQVAPILPLYIHELGLTNVASIAMWAGFAYGATTLTMTVASPIWGTLADLYGRKPMLLRASLGMAIVLLATAFVSSVGQLVAVRLFMGTISGYNSGSITLIATETPTEKSGWALGTLSTGAVCGQLLGPLLGGYLAEAVGLRENFMVMACFLFANFVLTTALVREDFHKPKRKDVQSLRSIWHTLPDTTMVVWMFVTTYLVMVTLFFVQPMLTIYVRSLAPTSTHIALLSGAAFAASGLSAVLSAPYLGRLSDRVGAEKVLVIALLMAAVVSIPQAVVTNVWQLMALRLIMGIPVGAMLPTVNTLLRQHIDVSIAGRIFSFNQSFQFLGIFSGSFFGGQVAAHLGIRSVFWAVTLILSLNAACVYRNLYRRLHAE